MDQPDPSPGPQSSKPKLLDQVREHCRLKHLARSTEKAYVGWIRRFILFHNKRHQNILRFRRMHSSFRICKTIALKKSGLPDAHAARATRPPTEWSNLRREPRAQPAAGQRLRRRRRDVSSRATPQGVARDGRCRELFSQDRDCGLEIRPNDLLQRA